MAKLLEEYKHAHKDLIRSYYDNLNESEKYKYQELKAIVVFQKYSRRLICRKRFLLLKNQSLEIQKSFRGYLARANHQKDVAEQNDNLMKQFFEYHRAIIVKHWLGYKCRKYVMDYHANRKWLKMTKLKNEEMLEKMKEYGENLREEMERKKDEDQRRQFNEIAKNLHHLVSTKAIPGVYNPPHMQEQIRPQVFNADVETHLRSIFKVSFRIKKLEVL